MRQLSRLSWLTVIVTSCWLLLSGILRVLDLTLASGERLPPSADGSWLGSGASVAILANGGLLIVAGCGVFAIVAQVWRLGPAARAVRPAALVVLAAFVGLALMSVAAAWDRWLPLVAEGAVSLLGLVLLGALLVLTWRLSAVRAGADAESAAAWGTSDVRLRWLVRGVTASLLLVIGTGAVVGTAGAALPCPSWPLCAGDQWLPATPSLAGGLHMAHRLVSALAALLVAATFAWVWIVPHGAAVRRAATALAALMVSQILLGGNFVVADGPAWLGVVHVAVALGIWAFAMRLDFLAAAGEVVAFESHRQLRTVTTGGGHVLTPPLPAAAAAHAAAVLPAAPTIVIAVPDLAVVRGRIADYVALTKPGILSLLLFTTFTAMLIAATGMPPFWLICVTLMGGILAAGGANVLNCYIDRDIDAQMTRTRHRATAAGRIPPSRVLVFGITLTGLAVLLLGVGANWVAAALALAGNLFYVFVYTYWLKRRTPQNIVIGGAAGAVPPLVGWAAVTGNLAVMPWLLFAVIFMWTPPHFWSLALLKQGEYGRALVPMLPVVAGEATTRRQIVLYSVLLFAVCLALVPAGLGTIYLVATVLVNGVFLAGAVLLYCRPTKRHARQLFFYSLWYLVLIFGAAVADRLIMS